jgi:hypothetical protein
MNPIISAALAEDHRHTLLAQATQSRRAALADAARTDVEHTTVARRAVTRPFVIFQGWLARGYL